MILLLNFLLIFSYQSFFFGHFWAFQFCLYICGEITVSGDFGKIRLRRVWIQQHIRPVSERQDHAAFHQQMRQTGCRAAVGMLFRETRGGFVANHIFRRSCNCCCEAHQCNSTSPQRNKRPPPSSHINHLLCHVSG